MNNFWVGFSGFFNNASFGNFLAFIIFIVVALISIIVLITIGMIIGKRIEKYLY